MTDSIADREWRFHQGTYSFQDLEILLRHYQQQKRYLEMRNVRIAGKRMQLSHIMKQGQTLRMQVVATSDDEKDEFRKLAWGDYWLQHELIWALGKRGFTMSRHNPHITLHLFGFPRQLPQNTFNMAWCTSHPELLTAQNAFQYDHIYTLGRKHAERMTQQGIHAEFLPAASSFLPYPDRTQQYPAIFIGNTKPQQGMRPCVQMLKESGYPFLVWGWGWEEHLPSENIAGRYFDYKQLDRLYAQSAFVLNDHHAAMQEVGMVSPKNYDVCSSGGMLVCERQEGIHEVFGDSVPQFGSSEELKSILFDLDAHPQHRETLRQQATEISLRYTFDRISETIYNHILGDSVERMNHS